MWALVGAVALIAGQVASPPASVDPASTAAEAAGKEKLICKKVRATGSRLKGGRTCLSAEAWKIRTAEDQQALKDMQNRRSCEGASC
jgi:hypothetical protein